MIKQLLGILVLVLIFASCQSTETKENPISEEHAALFGTWQENDSIQNITWEFNQYELKWKGFTHFYQVSGDSLIISGIVYRILEQSKNEMKLVTLNGKQCTLTRKSKY